MQGIQGIRGLVGPKGDKGDPGGSDSLYYASEFLASTDPIPNYTSKSSYIQEGSAVLTFSLQGDTTYRSTTLSVGSYVLAQGGAGSGWWRLDTGTNWTQIEAVDTGFDRLLAVEEEADFVTAHAGRVISLLDTLDPPTLSSVDLERQGVYLCKPRSELDGSSIGYYKKSGTLELTKFSVPLQTVWIRNQLGRAYDGSDGVQFIIRRDDGYESVFIANEPTTFSSVDLLAERVEQNDGSYVYLTDSELETNYANEDSAATYLYQSIVTDSIDTSNNLRIIYLPYNAASPVYSFGVENQILRINLGRWITLSDGTRYLDTTEAGSLWRFDKKRREVTRLSEPPTNSISVFKSINVAPVDFPSLPTGWHLSTSLEPVFVEFGLLHKEFPAITEGNCFYLQSAQVVKVYQIINGVPVNVTPTGGGAGALPVPSIARGELALELGIDKKTYNTSEGLVNADYEVGALREVPQKYTEVYQLTATLAKTAFVYDVGTKLTTISFPALPFGVIVTYATHVTLGNSAALPGVDHLEIVGAIDGIGGKVIVRGIPPYFVDEGAVTLRFTKVWTATPAMLEDELNVYPLRPNLDFIKAESPEFVITSYSVEDGLPVFVTSTEHATGTNLLPYAYANGDTSVIYKSVYSSLNDVLRYELIGRFAILNDYEYGFGSLLQSPDETGKDIKFAGIILYSTGARFQLESAGLTIELGDILQVSSGSVTIFNIAVNEIEPAVDGITRHWANVTAANVAFFTGISKGTQIRIRIHHIIEAKISFPTIPSFDLSKIKTLTFCRVESYDVFELDKDIARDLSTREGDPNKIGDVVVRNIRQLGRTVEMTITDTGASPPYEWATALPISTQGKYVLRDPALGEYIYDLKISNVGVDNETGKFRVYFNDLAEDYGIGVDGDETDMSRFASGFLVQVTVARVNSYVHRLKLAETFQSRFKTEVKSPQGLAAVKASVAVNFNSLFLENADTLYPYKMVTTLGTVGTPRIAYNAAGQSNLSNPLDVMGGNSASLRITPGTSTGLKHGYYYSLPFHIGPSNDSIKYLQIMSQVIRNGYSFDVYNVMTPVQYSFDRTIPDPPTPVPPHMISERTTQTTPIFGNLTGSYTFDFAIKLPSTALGSQAAQEGITWIWFRSRATTTFVLNYNIIMWHNDHTFKGSSNLDL